MSPDVNININLAGVSAAVSGEADTTAGSAVTGPPPDMEISDQASRLGQDLLAAPGPEDAAQVEAAAGGPPGPETGAAGALYAGAPPPFEVRSAATSGSLSLAPGPEDSSIKAAAVTSLSMSAPAPSEPIAGEKVVAKKSSRKKTSRKSRVKKKK